MSDSASTDGGTGQSLTKAAWEFETVIADLHKRIALADEVAALYYKLGAEALGAEEWERRCRAALNIEKRE